MIYSSFDEILSLAHSFYGGCAFSFWGQNRVLNRVHKWVLNGVLNGGLNRGLNRGLR